MPLEKHDQTPIGPKACGASCIMCAAQELGTLVDPFSDTTADAIYRRIEKAPNDESLVSKVAAELGTLGLKTELIEDADLTAKQGGLRDNGVTGPLAAGFGSAYADFKSDVKGKLTWTKRRRPNAFTAADFDGEARVMLVVGIATGQNQGKTHWVMARKDGQGQIMIMNPDGGTDSLDPGLLHWMNGPPAQPLKIGNVLYIFTGLALRVTK
ncbi:MAG: hypothetical protein K2X74_09670 [Acetobacteraceae bacterium]|nr:hypothetical protein [Acetobacteraceae bacterium]